MKLNKIEAWPDEESKSMTEEQPESETALSGWDRAISGGGGQR